MNLLVAVKSCQRHADLGYHQAIRDTWGRGLDVRFFMGRGDTGRYADETALNCADDYESLPWKTKAILEAFLSPKQNIWQYIFLCDNDTFIDPEKLLWLRFADYDYSGYFNRSAMSVFSYRDERGNWYPRCYSWASGGIGYFLNKKAASLVVEQYPHVWAEDMYVGQVLGPYVQKSQISVKSLENFKDVASWHFRRTKKYPTRYSPEMMYRSWILGNPQLMYEEDRK